MWWQFLLIFLLTLVVVSIIFMVGYFVFRLLDKAETKRDKKEK